MTHKKKVCRPTVLDIAVLVAVIQRFESVVAMRSVNCAGGKMTVKMLRMLMRLEEDQITTTHLLKPNITSTGI